MTDYERRLERLEAAIAPMLPRDVLVFGDEDPAEAIAAYRAANNWSDDDMHPVHVMRIVWFAAKDGRPENSFTNPPATAS
jgi:hypothetical protein